MLSTFTYLTDVDESTPGQHHRLLLPTLPPPRCVFTLMAPLCVAAFAVIPQSRRIDNLQALADVLGEDYAEVPIHGPAGTCCIVDR